MRADNRHGIYINIILCISLLQTFEINQLRYYKRIRLYADKIIRKSRDRTYKKNMKDQKKIIGNILIIYSNKSYNWSSCRVEGSIVLNSVSHRFIIIILLCDMHLYYFI